MKFEVSSEDLLKARLLELMKDSDYEAVLNAAKAVRQEWEAWKASEE